MNIPNNLYYSTSINTVAFNNLRKITKEILDFMEDMRFTTDLPLDSDYLKNTIDRIIQKNLENKDIQTYSDSSCNFNTQNE
jgi:hypothetical protein